ncbi:hypothetical protein [Sulfurimonas sp.]|jgi:hypothetical protein|uniref:hypothetical protein n=1 Tax=Sulfurimonas sp. TaxID=2022749 RepID=UPI002A36F74C|nr:hypothetical protein [Sulfurimonas sp.]MDY0123548.1 hypothetical protein [Sulfurimonas sp.]
MQNPFETGHIKNYILLYVSVVVIMVLFFIATSLFHDVESVEIKLFSTDVKSSESVDKREKISKDDSNQTQRFKLLDKAY